MPGLSKNLGEQGRGGQGGEGGLVKKNHLSVVNPEYSQVTRSNRLSVILLVILLHGSPIHTDPFGLHYLILLLFILFIYFFCIFVILW